MDFGVGEKPAMERRQFLYTGAALSSVAVLGMFGRAAFAKCRLTNQLVSDASSVLVEKEHQEITAIPKSASDEMKLWFTGACLNAVQFVEYICSEAFVSRLGQFATHREREMCVANAFFARVLSHSAIYQRVDLILAESGAILDRNWRSCCEQIADKWKLKLNPSSEDLGATIRSRLDGLVSAELDIVIYRIANVANRPSLLSSADGIGRASLMVLPLATLPPPYNQTAIPAFALIAITHLASYAIGVLLQDIRGAKAAISDRLAVLGNRVANEFNAALKTRIADLHAWQNEALRKAAGEYADEAIGII